MKKLFLLFAALCCMMVAGAQSHGPEDEDEQLEVYQEACIKEIEECLVSSYNPNIHQVVVLAIDDIMGATSKDQVTQIRDLAMAKIDALAQIDAYKIDKTFTKEEETWLNDFTSTICQAQDTYTVNMARDNALGIYALRDIKSQAISDINAAMQWEASSTLINSVVADDIEAIKSANTAEAVNVRKTEAIWKLTTAQQLYQAIKADILGTLATPQNGPSFEVTDQNDKVIRLYNPKHAKLIEENK